MRNVCNFDLFTTLLSIHGFFFEFIILHDVLMIHRLRRLDFFPQQIDGLRIVLGVLETEDFQSVLFACIWVER